MSEKAWLSRELKGGKIICEACSQACVLSEGVIWHLRCKKSRKWRN